MATSTSFNGTERFEVQRCLGSGSFGAVFEVLDRERNARVALKLPHESSALNLLLFKQEFRALKEASHPNLLTLLELMTDGNTWFFTMELVDGIDCFTYLRQGSDSSQRSDPTEPQMYYIHGSASHPSILPPEPTPNPARRALDREAETIPISPTYYSPPRDFDRIRRVLVQMAEGLTALHSLGLSHRDLKPSNVLVTREERVVILDFGLVLDSGDMGLPEEGSLRVAGTPAYIAPEQIDGDPGSAASDWYSAGVILYQALTGCLPYTGNSVEMIRAKRAMDPCPPSLLVPGIPEDLEHICMDLLARDPESRLNGAGLLSRLTSTATKEQPKATGLDFSELPLSRRSGLQTLLEAYDMADQGQTVVVQLEGEPGMGKSTLLRYFQKEARNRNPRGLHLRARCCERENVPFKAVDGLVDGLCRFLQRLQPAEVKALLPVHTPVLARLFPVLNLVQAVADWPTPPAHLPDLREFRYRAFEAFRDLIGGIARRRPVTMVLDDLQWGDMDSTAMLAELLRAPFSPPVLLVLCFRPEDEGGIPLLHHLKNPDGGHSCQMLKVTLGPLSEAESAEQAFRMLSESRPDAKELAGMVARESEGHPFFLSELAHALTANVDATFESHGSLEAHLRGRMEHLEASSKRLMNILCVAGHPLDWHVLADASGLAWKADNLLPMLRNGRFLRIKSSGADYKLVEPFHERVRQTVLDALPEEKIKESHLLLAESLERNQPQEIRLLAIHYLAASERTKAIHYTAEAGRLAVRALAFDQAAGFFQQSISLRNADDEELLDLWTRLSDSLANAGRSHEAALAYLTASGLATEHGAKRLRRRAAEEFFHSGYIDDGVMTLKHSLASIGTYVPTTFPEAVFSLLKSRFILWARGLSYKIRQHDEIPQEELDRIDVLWALAMGLGPIDLIRGADFQARQLRLALDAGEPFRIVRGLAHEAIFQAVKGNKNLTKTQAVLDATSALAERIGHPNPKGRALISKGIAALLQGQWKSATGLLVKGERMLKEHCTGIDYEVSLGQHYLLMAHSVMGDIKMLAERLPLIIQKTRERGDLLALTNFRTSLSYLVFLAKDTPDLALANLNDAMSAWNQGTFHTIHYHELVARVNIELYAGRPREARDFLLQQWPALRRSSQLYSQAMRITCMELRARTAVAMAASMPSGAKARSRLLRLVQADIRSIRKEHTPYGEGLALKLLACACQVDGDSASTIALLQQASASFRSCDMALHSSICDIVVASWTGDVELRETAEEWMNNQGIVAPKQWIKLFVPTIAITHPQM